LPTRMDAEQGEHDELGEVRYVAMTFISIIPFFNTLAWVFAALDSRQVRYAAYSAAYSFFYISTFQDTEEWQWLLPLVTFACIAQVQIDRTAERYRAVKTRPPLVSVQPIVGAVKSATQRLNAWRNRPELPKAKDGGTEDNFDSEVQENIKAELRKWDEKFLKTKGEMGNEKR